MRYALIIGNGRYSDPKLARLKTPTADVRALADVLGDQGIGGFDNVKPLDDPTEKDARLAISSFLANKKPDDLVLVYFSGHGVLDSRGRLFLAFTDTITGYLSATAVPSAFIVDQLDECRSRRQILILDCCHSGAFERGGKGEQKAITEATFEGSGFGRVVLTATDQTELALEGDQVMPTHLSLFTHFLAEGLKTGAAAHENHEHITLDEWYDYAYSRVVSETSTQRPKKWSYRQEGDLIIARNPCVKKPAAELPAELVRALESPFSSLREGAAREMGRFLRSHDPALAELARSRLQELKDDDSRAVSATAERLLSEYVRPATGQAPKTVGTLAEVVAELTGTEGNAEQARLFEEEQARKKAQREARQEEVKRVPTKKEKQEAEAWIRRGDAKYAAEQYEQAITEYSRAIELNPQDADVWNKRGNAYSALERYEEALGDYSDASRVNPQHAEACFNRGNTYSTLQRYDAALADYSSATQINPQYAEAYFNRGNTYFMLDRFDAALADYSKAIQINPQYADAYACRGIARLGLLQYDAAVADFNRAIKLNPANALAFNGRGKAFFFLKKYDQALADCNRAIELDPKDADTITVRGEILLLLRKYDQALADCNRAIELAPDDEWAYYQRSLIFILRNRNNEARRDLAQAIEKATGIFEKEPGDWENAFNLGLFHLASQNFKQSEQVYRDALRGNIPAIWLGMAKNDLENFLSLFPDNVHAKAMRALFG